MGAAGSHISRYARRFNVIERTERVINKDKPTPAPLHKADAERLKHLRENDPHVEEEIKNKNSALEKNLQSVYVTSEGDLPDIYSKSKSKLPQQREQVFNSGFNIQEPEYVPPGRYTLTQIVECLADHYKDKQTYSAKVLANRLNIDEQIMDNILKYYRVFDMYIPPKMQEKKKKTNLLDSTIDKIRLSLEVDKYKNKHKLLDEKQNNLKEQNR